MEDSKIIKLILTKESDGLNLLIEKYGRLIYSKILKTLGEIGKDEVDQVFNDVLMTFWQNIDCYDASKGSLANYLMALSKYKSIDFIRKNTRHVDNQMELKEEILNVADEEDFSEELIKDNESFFKMISVLKEDTQRLFVLRYLMEKPIEEIAVDLNMTSSNVYTKLSRGRDKIKKLLGGNKNGR
ncbi:MAG: sigma-70 family RNA polymerase sigma factor [Clostridium sp.]